MEKEIVKRLKKNISNKNVLVVGEPILDISYFCTAMGLSLETPTLKAKENQKKIHFGGALNVAKNIAKLGANCTFLTLVGKDEYTSIYDDIEQKGLDFVGVKDDRKNTVKKRFWIERGGKQYKYFQLNTLDNDNISLTVAERIKEIFEQYIGDVDVVLFVDYRNGLMTKELINSLKTKAIQNNKLIIVNSQKSDKHSNYDLYRGVDIICMNMDEAKSACKKIGCELENLCEGLGSNICITNGDHGASFFTLKKEKYESNSIEVEEVDSCGAGDCFLSMLAVTDVCKNPKESLFLSNAWAGLSVQYIGTSSPTPLELYGELEKYDC